MFYDEYNFRKNGCLSNKHPHTYSYTKVLVRMPMPFRRHSGPIKYIYVSPNKIKKNDEY
jgi:hypothetical protein